MFKQALAVVALAALTACGGGGGGDAPGAGPVAEAPAAPAAPQPPKRVCSAAINGDSIADGATMSGYLAERPSAALKRLRPAYTVIDRSESNSGAYWRFPMVLGQPVDTRITVLQWGMNDSVGTTVVVYKQALHDMIAHIRAGGGVAVITGISRVAGNFRPERDAFDKAAREVAAAEGVPFADWGSVPFTDADNADPLHPAQAYSTRLVEKLVATLDRVLPECAS